MSYRSYIKFRITLFRDRPRSDIIAPPFARIFFFASKASLISLYYYSFIGCIKKLLSLHGLLQDIFEIKLPFIHFPCILIAYIIKSIDFVSGIDWRKERKFVTGSESRLGQMSSVQDKKYQSVFEERKKGGARREGGGGEERIGGEAVCACA